MGKGKRKGEFASVFTLPVFTSDLEARIDIWVLGYP